MDASIRREPDRLYAAAESRMVALYACEAVRDKDNDIEDFVFTYLNRNVEKMVLIPRQVMLIARYVNIWPPLLREEYGMLFFQKQQQAASLMSGQEDVRNFIFFCDQDAVGKASRQDAL